MNHKLELLRDHNKELALSLKALCYTINGCCQQVHKELGPWLNEYVYQAQSYINTEYDLIINPYYLVPSKTEYKKQPLTKTGKSPKYPTCFSYATPDVGREQFGEAWLLADGSIGKARMITWINRIGYQIHLALIENTLRINNIEFINAAERHSKWKVVYKI